MARLKLLKNNQVFNVIEADLQWAQENYPDCEIIEEPLPVIVDPAPPQPPPQPSLNTQLTKYQFRKRFTMEELLKFDSPEVFLQNPTQEQLLIIKTLKKSYDDATSIDLDDPLLQYGLNLMVQWGLLTEERKNEILDKSK